MKVNRTSNINEFVKWFPEVDVRLFENLNIRKLELVADAKTANWTSRELSFGWGKPQTFIYERDERLEA